MCPTYRNTVQTKRRLESSKTRGPEGQGVGESKSTSPSFWVGKPVDENPVTETPAK